MNRKTILWISILVPIVIVILFRVKIDGYDFHFLPPIYAGINALTAVLLLVALFFIKQKKQAVHSAIMEVCLGLSLLFLILYIVYHMTSDPTPYGGSGPLKYVYYSVLISHILLSVVIIPLVLFSYYRAVSGDFIRHKALVRYAFPAWLYVAISGVVVYLMISPYYPA